MTGIARAGAAEAAAGTAGSPANPAGLRVAAFRAMRWPVAPVCHSEGAHARSLTVHGTLRAGFALAAEAAAGTAESPANPAGLRVAAFRAMWWPVAPVCHSEGAHARSLPVHGILRATEEFAPGWGLHSTVRSARSLTHSRAHALTHLPAGGRR